MNNNAEEKLPELPPHVIEQFVKAQYQKAVNEAEEIRLRSRDIDHQAEYARKLLDYQAQVTTNHPHEHRKTVTRYAWIGGSALILILAFIYMCLAMGKDHFIDKFLDIASYVVVSGLSFYFGRKTGSNEGSSSGNKSKEQDAELIE